MLVMKSPFMASLFLLLAAGAVAEPASLAERFAHPPASSALQTWFHWNGDCVTKEGLAADLKAMGEMEIGTAHVFLPAMANLPVTARPLTPEWFDLWETAVREAKRNNVKLGFHNCPGWSSSGGPWITPENAMKMVVASATDWDPASGGAAVALPRPLTVCDFYRDIEVLAFPMPRPPRLVKANGDFPGDFDGFCRGTAPLTLPLGKAGARCELTLEYDRPSAPGTAVFTVDDTQFYAKGDIAASADGHAWTTCANWEYKLFNAQKTPKTLRLEQTPAGARFFRVRFNYIPCPPWVGVRDKKLTSFAFTELPLVEDVDAKNSASTSFAYRPPRPGEEGNPGIAKDAFVDLTSALRADGTVDVTPLLARTGDRCAPQSRGAAQSSNPQFSNPQLANAQSANLQSNNPHSPIEQSNNPNNRTIEQSAASTVWRILRIGYTATGKMCAPATLRGLECDKLSKRGLDAHWPHMPKRLVEAPEAKGTVVLSIIDSYEVGGQNWTEDFPAEFRKRRGYDLLPWLPAVAGYTVGTAGETARFLYDYQRTVADLFAENYYDYFAELCHRAGIEAATEPYGGPFDSLRCGAASDVPTGEFWLGREPHGSPRVAASIGHLNGRARIAAESFTTEAKEGRWQITPAELRRCGDQGWLDGISQLVYHSYLHQPFTNVKPGISLGRHGTQLNRHTTWWPEGVHWSRYVRRGQFLLQSGRPRAEVLVFAGDGKPNAWRYASELCAAGGNFDYCGAADMARLQAVDGGVAVPGQLPYDVLHLGPDSCLTRATLDRLAALVAAGARVAGPKPLGTPSLSDDPVAWRKAVDALWDGGRIRPANNAREALAAFGLRVNADSDGRLRALRREVEGRDVYFVVNPRDTAFAGDVSFAARGAPELWDAVDGSTRPLPVVAGTDDAGRVGVQFELPPHGSCFVVFDPAATPSATVPAKAVALAEVSVLSARYCARDDRTLGRDVTERVRRLLADGRRAFKVENAVLGGDPASHHYKILDLVYTVDGARRQQTVQERAVVSFAFPRPDAPKPEKVLADLSRDWTVVSFDGPDAPAAPRRLDRLASWSASDDPKLRHFAGRAVYEKTVERLNVERLNVERLNVERLNGERAGGGIVLDLGEVRDVVNVSVDGKFLGCLWAPPYRIRIPADLLARTGDRCAPQSNNPNNPNNPNKRTILRLEVVNTWPNRLIGDARARQAGAAEPQSPKGPWPEWVLANRPDSGTGIFTWSNFMGWKADEPLLPAGLIGPVRLLRED